MTTMIGIDLGTTNSCVAFWDGRGARVIPNRDGARITPSVVSFDENDRAIVGAPAQRRAALNPTGTVFAAKRLMGRKHDEPQIVEWAKLIPYAI